MEIIPIKRDENIKWLSKEHHFGLLACWKINKGITWGIGIDRIKKYIIFFWENNLQQHFKEEEELLFNVIDDDKINTAIEQHTSIREKINALYNSHADTLLLQQFAEELNDHIRYEERILFPFLEKALPQNELQQIGAALDSSHSNNYNENYPDEFWMKKDDK
ncbi:MAG TPA: hemerythrin domain-containing protein [Chitinophagaceae bacterium]